MAVISGRTLLVTTLALIAVAFLAPRADAANFVVNSFADGVDASIGNGVCQTSTPGQCTLRAAVQETNALSGADSITFSVTGNHIISSSLGPLIPGTSASGNLTITGNGDSTSGTLINANGNASLDQIVNANTSGSSTVSLSMLQLSGLNHGSAGGSALTSSGGTLNLNRVKVSANLGGYGAGVSAFGGTLNIVDSTISGNTDGDAAPGGGISTINTTFSLTRSAVTSNLGPGGSAMVLNGPSSTIANSTISGNADSSVSPDGAIRNDSGTLSIRNSTIAGNAGPAGNVALKAYAAINIANSIVSSSGAACSTFVTSGGNNIISDGTCSPVITDKANTNPQLAALADNGGPTETMAITSASPAFNAANNAICAAAPVANLDQRGISRPQGQVGDIGAFELQVAAPTPGASTPPSNDFSVGKLRLKANGTAVLPVIVKAAGVVKATDVRKSRTLIRQAKARSKGSTIVWLRLKPTALAKNKLEHDESVKTNLKIAFRPTGGSANSLKTGARLRDE